MESYDFIDFYYRS